MKKSTLLCSLLLMFSYACQPTETFFEDAFCIENISVIDPENGLLENQTVIIRDGIIHKITPTEDLRLSENNQIIDGTGKYMIPGLWDTHVHFAFIEELAPRMFDLFLAYGITSVRDTGGETDVVIEWKEKALSNPEEAPRVKIAGPLLDGMPNVYDGSSPGRPALSVGLHDIEDVATQVQKLDSIGVDLLKAYEMLTPEQFSALTQLAGENGLKVTGHVPLSMDVISASNAGLNSMEHLRNLELSTASNAEELLEERRQLLAVGKDEAGGVLRSRIHDAQRERAVRNYDENRAEEVLGVLARNETWQIPTLALNTGAVVRHYADPEWMETFRYLPDSIAQDWKASIEEIESTEVSPFRELHSEWMLDMVGNIHQAGIGIMAGTDTPIAFLTPGRSLHQELVLLVRAGLSPLEALKTATINPAKYFNLENELGSIRENMWADLVILDANPLENIQNTLRINAVIKQGKYHDRNSLNQRLEGLGNQ